ncbi:hypothetical protein BX616_007642, partial [Lobosporangium transversale]
KVAKKPELGHAAADKLTLYKVFIDEDKTVIESEIVSKETLVPASMRYLILNFQGKLSMFLSSHHSE